MIINNITKQKYIGQTIQNLDSRWNQHKKQNSKCHYLRSAFHKYGYENFTFKLICICFDEDLNKFEIEYIKKYNSIVPNGYNIKLGGNSGGKHNEETKQKISQSLKNNTTKNHSNHQLGKPHTEEIKLKISNSLKGRVKSEETKEKFRKSKTKYKVYKLNDNKEIICSYIGYNEAAKSVDGTKTTIFTACKINNKRAYGYYWKKELII